MGVDLGSIGRSNQRADLVGRPVKGSRFAFRRAVKDVDESPTEILGIGFKSGPGHHGEEIGPDRFEGLDDRLPDWEIACRYGSRSNREAGKIEPGELIGE